jgi:predicted phage terminase large subunit-like protein
MTFTKKSAIPTKATIAASEQKRRTEKDSLRNAERVQGIKLNAALMEGFVKRFLSERFDGSLPTPQFHREMWEDCTSDVEKWAGGAPRGHAKSTSITHSYGLAASLFRVRNFTLIVSDTWAQSVEFLRDIKTELTDNDELREAFGIKRLVKDAEDDIIVLCNDGHRFRFLAKGAGQKVRGLKWNGGRPNLIIIDDLDDDETVLSKERREKLYDWFLRALIPCGSKDCLYRMVGTILHDQSTLALVLKSSDWKSKVYRAHKSFDDFSEVLWSEHKSADELRKIRDSLVEKGKADAYSSEYLNEPVAEGNAFFLPPYLAMSDEDMKRRGTYYIGWDVAVSTSTRADYTVAAVVKVDQDGIKHVVEINRSRRDAASTIELMFQLNETYNPACHFGEKGVIDAAISPFLTAEMMKRQKYFSLIRLNRSKDKRAFAGPLQAMLRAGHMYFNKDMRSWAETEEELKRFLKSGHDDIVDALAVIAQGVSNLITETDEELEDEEFFNEIATSQLSGRNLVTGY